MGAAPDRTRDLPPKQIVPRLADENDYVGSESMVYRVFRAQKLMAHRGKSKAPVSRPRAEYIAVGPCEVCGAGTFVSAHRDPRSVLLPYLMMGIWSRKVMHADNGGLMKGATLKATMANLGVIAEALFRTARYRPEYPKKPFASLEAAREWVARFVAWYNDVHLHSGIGHELSSGIYLDTHRCLRHRQWQTTHRSGATRHAALHHDGAPSAR